MKPTNLAAGRILLATVIIATTFALVSWDFKQNGGLYKADQTDTVPKKSRDKKIRDLDDVLQELDDADLKVDMEKVQKELAEAMKKIDADKIRFDIQRAMQEIDLEKMKKEIETSVAKIDFDKIKRELAEAMKEIDAAKIQHEIQESLSKIEWDKMKAEMEKVKEIDMKKIDAEMKKVAEEMKDLGPQLEKELANAKKEIEKAKAEVKEFKIFVDELENDGLINKKEGYTLKHKDGELYINGKKASDQTYNKYRSFLDKHKKFNIEKDDNDFDMDLD